MGTENSIAMDEAHLHKLQSEILDLLVEFDRVCKKNNIRYFLSCGTLLGAVRHHGFIPWDNDADVELFREDYEKFCLICETELKDEFFFLDHNVDKNYFWPFGKLVKKNTSYERPNQGVLNQKNGICIDVFVLDKMPEDTFGQRKMEYITTLCRKILWAPVGVKALPFSLEWIVFYMLSHISRDWAYKLHQDTARRYEETDNEYRGFFGTRYRSPRGYALKEEWYEKTLDCEFEGHIFSIPNGYDNIMYLKYDNYMVLPPVEQRKGSSPAEYIRFSDGEEWYASK